MSEPSAPWKNVEQPADDETAGSPWFNTNTYTVFQSGLKSLLEELHKYSQLARELGLLASPYKQEIDRIQQMVEWGEDRLKKDNKTHGTITVSGASYGSLRYLKAGMLLLVRMLVEKKRAVIQKHGSIPRSILKSYDEKIKVLENLAEEGVLNGLKPAEVFFELRSPVNAESSIEIKKEAVDVKLSESRIDEIQIIDPVLRERCLDLLRKLYDAGSQVQLDTIVRESSVVLEDRVKTISGIKGKIGVPLMSAAFGSQPVVIKFSDDRDVQDSAHFLFRGYSGFVRNQVMHRLVPSYNKDRVLQLMGFVDYLLFLLSRAERTVEKAGRKKPRRQ